MLSASDVRLSGRNVQLVDTLFYLRKELFWW